MIAREFDTTVANLVLWNKIKDPNYIVVGQELNVSEATPAETQSTPQMAVVNVFGLQSNSDRTVYASWTWSGETPDHYEVKWYYDTGDGIWFVGNSSNIDKDETQAIYNAPTNALSVKFIVRPVAPSTSKWSTTTTWTASWSTAKIYNFIDNPPTTPSAPTVTLKDYTLTASLVNLNVNGTQIEFQIVKDDSSIFNTGKANITTASASYACTVSPGGNYKVRCRSIRGSLYSEWSEYSSNVGTKPDAPAGITVCKATSETAVYLEWKSVNTAVSYDLQFTTKKEYFDGSDQVNSVTDIEFAKYTKTGLESGQEYLFRVRAVNEQGPSAWSGITSVVIGKAPAAPTTWSSVTTAITGEPLNLYWIHNSEDGSSQTYAELELTIDNVTEKYTIKNSTDEDEKDKTSVYSIATSDYIEGTKIQWRVRTAGITNTYGDWSVQRTVDIYTPPTLELSVTNVNGDPLETLESFPFYIYGLAAPNTQLPIGYHLIVTANESYETVDNVGNTKTVNSGEQIYTKYFDTSDPLMVEMSAGNINLENNISYTITCIVSMNSGLTAESSFEFTVAWTDVGYFPNAEMSIDKDTLVAYIHPYAIDSSWNLVDGVKLSVYRREFDGGFTEIATGLNNIDNTFVTDPHPSLDYARYRIVAISDDTGTVSYYDVPGYPVDEKTVIIQWNEDWTTFHAMNEDKQDQAPWTGSILKLPYNIDISDSNRSDVSLIEYIGRKHPVSYYGTQLGETSSWNVEIDKSDKETLYALRRLKIYMGDVYVREPSGSGYWANISVSFSQKHCETTIPVTLSVTRVEGGI